MILDDFNNIYVLHLSSRPDRELNFRHQLNKIGLLNKYEIWWTTHRPISTQCGDMLTTMHTIDYSNRKKDNKNIYGPVFNCALEHYTIIRSAYERGFNNIIIFEDDVRFYIDEDTFNHVINNMPDDYDICKFYSSIYSFTDDEGHLNKVDLHPPKLTELTTNLFSLVNPFQYCYHSTLAYALSRRGMRQMLDSYEDKWQCADMAFHNIKDPNCKFYNTNYLICDNMDWRSDIW